MTQGIKYQFIFHDTNSSAALNIQKIKLMFAEKLMPPITFPTQHNFVFDPQKMGGGEIPLFCWENPKVMFNQFSRHHRHFEITLISFFFDEHFLLTLFLDQFSNLEQL